MAYAVAQLMSIDPGPTGPQIRLFMTYYGQGVPGGQDSGEAVIDFAPGDTANTIRNKMSQAVTGYASNLRYPLVAGDVLLPVFQKG